MLVISNILYNVSISSFVNDLIKNGILFSEVCFGTKG